VKVEISEFAERDLSEGFFFYEAQATGLGEYFVDSVLGDIQALSMTAGIHRKVYGMHRMLTHIFPYAVYYEVWDTVAYVYAIYDCRGDPIKAKEQMGKRKQSHC
jgi:hypothetical protein